MYLLTRPLSHPPWPKFTLGSVLSLWAGCFTGPFGRRRKARAHLTHGLLHLRSCMASRARDSDCLRCEAMRTKGASLQPPLQAG